MFGWSGRERRLISIKDRARAINGWDVTDDYLDWFLPRTHPRLDPRSGTTQMSVPVPRGPHAVDHLRVCIRLNYRFFGIIVLILYFILLQRNQLCASGIRAALENPIHAGSWGVMQTWLDILTGEVSLTAPELPRASQRQDCDAE